LFNKEIEEKKRPRKEGRTLLINCDYTEEINLNGIQKIHQTNSGSRFVVFDTTENARSAFKNFKELNIKVKYSYYKIFFRLADVDLQNVMYDDLKDQIKNMINELNDVNILYFKFYTKNGNLMGSGDLTVDTKDSLDLLVANNEYDFGNGKISFYRYHVRKNRDNEKIQTSV